MTKSFSTVVRFVLLTLMLGVAGCPVGDPSRFEAGFVAPACGPADGPAIAIRLSEGAVECGETNARAPGISLFVAPATIEPRGFDAAEHTIELCDDDATCTEIERGFIEILTVEDERVEVGWSLELPDGQHDVGTMWVPRCEPVSPRCG